MAVDIFLKLTDIKGESMDSKHPDEIQVLAWSWGMSQAVRPMRVVAAVREKFQFRISVSPTTSTRLLPT